MHRCYAGPDRMLCGGYVRLEQDVTERLTEEDVTSGGFESLLDARARRQLLRKHLKARWEMIWRKP